MHRFIFLFLFLTFHSLAEQLPPCKGDYWTNCFGENSTNEGTFTVEILAEAWAKCLDEGL